MERESFEDEEVAKLLNEHYVSIKVDREERPDIDHIYMRFCQVMTGQGGWPLTIVMTPNQEPFYAATYLPKERRFGRAGLLELLPKIAGEWALKADELTAWSQRVSNEMQSAFSRPMEGEPGWQWIEDAIDSFTSTFDADFGGFGDAPKFPSPHNLMFLLRQAVAREDERCLEMVTTTLDGMRQGGIYDHVGGGFSRYSTDAQWLVPHFEKMLYDNALLVMAYAEAFQVTQRPLYRETVRETIAYLKRDMLSPSGGFTSAEDADSEGEEGRFYIWTPEQIIDVLGESDGHWFCEHFDITEAGNFEGRNIPNLIGRLHKLEDPGAATRLQHCREKLLRARSQRVRPHRDDKVLTSWNGLMMAALAIAGRALSEPEHIQLAEETWRFLRTNLRRDDGRLLARFRDGEAAHLGYLDDYAFVIWGLIELYEATFNTDYLAGARGLQTQMHALFLDAKNGGYFFNGADGERLLSRPKEIYDGAMPSGNSVAAVNAIRLARLTGDMSLEDEAQQIFAAFAADVGFAPSGHTFLLTALDLVLRESEELVMVVASALPEAWQHDLFTTFRPGLTTILKTSENAARLADLSPFTASQEMLAGAPTLYLCKQFACRQPVTDFEAIRQLIGTSS